MWFSNATVLLLFHCCVQLFVTSWTAALQISLSFTISRSLLRKKEKKATLVI